MRTLLRVVVMVAQRVTMLITRTVVSSWLMIGWVWLIITSHPIDEEEFRGVVSGGMGLFLMLHHPQKRHGYAVIGISVDR
jgi:hypothetical protein